MIELDIKSSLLYRIDNSSIHGQGAFAIDNIKAGIWIDTRGLYTGLNHACRPNCKIVVGIVTSIKEIEEGEELTVSYADYVNGACNCIDCR